MSGTGFTANAPVTINFDGKPIGTPVNASAGGIVVVIFKIPAATGGVHTITATDGTHTGTTTFTVESVPPSTPKPVKPEMSVEVKSPITFEWLAAVDPAPASNPVTYELQIATRETFNDSSIVIDKTKIATTSYALTPLEETELEGRTTPYYWRLRAVDAASNPSPWTGTGEFYVPGSGVGGLPSWALYAILGVGAVIVFLIGYWLGRRSAFYY